MTSTSSVFDLSNFHGVGKPIEGAMSIDEALIQSGLNFTVSQHDLIVVGRNYKYDSTGKPIIDSMKNHHYYGTNVSKDKENPCVLNLSQDSKYHGLTFPSMCPIVRDDNMQVISIMGSGYKIVQNRECVQTLADIIEESKKDGCLIEIFRGGVINGCDFLYLAAKLPNDMEIEDSEGKLIAIHKYLLIQWSHTGASKIVLSFVTYDPIFKVFLYNGSSDLDVSIRHTKNARERLDDAKKYLRKMYSSFSSFKEQLENLSKKAMNQVSFEKFLEDHIFSIPENINLKSQSGKRLATSIDNKRAIVSQKFNKNKGDSAYDAYTTLCEYHDKDVTVKQKKEGKKDDELRSESELRLFSSFRGSSVKSKKNAFDILMDL